MHFPHSDSTKPLNILLVEDNPGDIVSILKAFSTAPIPSHVSVSKDGVEALSHLKTCQTNTSGNACPDVILLDINMPKMNGFEFLQAAKANSRHQLIPVIMLTSSLVQEDVLLSYKLGAASFIHKPPDYNGLVTIINAFLAYWRDINLLPPVPAAEN